MIYNNIYKNGKVDRFFLKVENDKEFNAILKTYFLVTDYEHTRKGRILEMECLFSSEIWQGRQLHGYGYACCSDVYDTLIDIICKLYKKELSENELKELYNINTHDERIIFSNELLDKLIKLNNQMEVKGY